MGLTTSIIYAAHARGTHHKLALDALDHLGCRSADGWRRLLFKHAAVYVQGSKAPDDEFKDFQNHVLHVRDGYWGGAADKVESWYGHLVKALAGERWSEAAWAAGVLSHYYTDPIHPFHTAQSEAENSIHRACEWSISRAYDGLRADIAREAATLKIAPGTSPAWLREHVVEGAERANRAYEKLIAHYDITRGVVDPPAGLDVVARRLVAELLAYATKGFAAVLDRAIAQSNVEPPEVNLTLDALAAIARLPRNAMLKRFENAAERHAVEAMFDELKATGRVEKSLPEDERTVREAYERDVVIPDLAAREKARMELITMPPRYARGYHFDGAKAAAPPAAPARDIATAIAPVIAPAASAQTAPAAPLAPALAALSTRPVSQVIVAEFGDRDHTRPRSYLAPADDVERAPSIGPKMAERLYAIGVRTVADLFAADPETLADKLDVRSVSDETVADWQDQARLVCAVPGLRGTHAQLLVGAGYRSRDAIAAALEAKLCADVLSFAVSTDGQRILRDGNPPDIERIKGWLASAIAAKVA